MRLKIVLAAIFLVLMAVMLSLISRNPDDPVVAFVDVNLVPMTEEIVLERQTVLVKEARIIEVGPSDQIPIRDNMVVINGEGKYLLPGLADMHMHTREDWEEEDFWPVNPLVLYLANGVTTIRDLGPAGSEINYPLQWREEIEAGTRIGPRIITSGKILFSSPLKDPAGLVQSNYDQGFDFQKIYSYVSGPDFYRALWQAQDLGMYVVGHIPYAVGLEGSLAGGMDEIAHVEELIYEFFDFDRNQELSPEDWTPVIIQSALGEYDFTAENLILEFIEKNSPVMDEITTLLQEYDAPVSTTLTVDAVVVMKNLDQEEFLARPENRYLEEGYLESYLEGNEKHLNQCRGVQEVCAAKAVIDFCILAELHEAEVTLVLGTDSGTGGMGIIPGFSVHDELRLLVENGFSPYEALKTGTVNAAEVVERMIGEGDFGSIEVGKRADLILARGNPLVDLNSLRNPTGVMAAGRWYSAEVLQRLIDIEEIK